MTAHVKSMHANRVLVLATLAAAAMGADADGCACGRPLPSFENVTDTWPRWCGDEIIDPGEECDDGNHVDGDGCAANCVVELGCAETGACSSSSTNDPGATTDPTSTGGSSTEGESGVCDSDCSTGPGCEGGCTSETGCDGGCCGICDAPRYVFLTQDTFVIGSHPSKTSLMGIEGDGGADQMCQIRGESLLDTLEIPAEDRRFAAWISDGAHSPVSDFNSEGFTGQYILPNGVLVAEGWAGFSSGGLLSPVAVTETLAEKKGGIVWTNTGVQGQAMGLDCGAWKDGVETLKAYYGEVGAMDQQWTYDVKNLVLCTSSAHLICVEIPSEGRKIPAG